MNCVYTVKIKLDCCNSLIGLPQVVDARIGSDHSKTAMDDDLRDPRHTLSLKLVTMAS